MVNQCLIVIDPKQRQNEKRNIIKNHELNNPPNPDKDYLIAIDVSRLVFHRIYGAKELKGDAHVKKYIHDQIHAPMLPLSCHIRATSSGIKWISMVGFGVRFARIVWQSLRFTRDYADLRSGFSFAGVAQW
jgi:hypothetical protein